MAHKPTHPGAVLKYDVLPALGLTVKAAAADLGVTRQILHRILAEKGPVTAEMALRLGKYCGNGPDLWLSMQTNHDLWHAKRKLRRELGRIREAQDKANQGRISA